MSIHFCLFGHFNYIRRRRLSGGAGPPKFNQLEVVTTCTYRPSLVKIDARNFELSWLQNTARPPARPYATDGTDYNTLRRYA